jgi:hypothetical protein
MSGTGSFIGGDTREEGQEAYRKIIESYRQNASSGIGRSRADGREYGIHWGDSATEEIMAGGAVSGCNHAAMVNQRLPSRLTSLRQVLLRHLINCCKQ